MKKYRVWINVILICICVFSIIAFALLIKSCREHWIWYNLESKNIPDQLIESFRIYLSETLQLTFSIVFSALSAIASIIVLLILNIKVIKATGTMFFEPAIHKIEARKQTRASAKAEKAEADKQAKIEKLKKKLEELTKD